MDVKKTYCWFCYAGCPVLVHIDNGKVVKIEGDKDGHYQGFTCEKGRAAPEVHYHPDRLNYPMKRVGERGEGKWQRISWDQALDDIAEKLRIIREKYGPEAVASTRGSWKPHYMFMARFFHLFGSPNYVGPGHICFNNESAIATATIGGFTFPSVSEDTKCLVIWAKNPASSMPHRWAYVTKLHEKGLKVIVVDPRPSLSTHIADIWLRIRPGTDGALALAWLNVIINEKLYGQDFVAKWTVGFDKLAERVRKYPPEWASEVSGVPADIIRQSARIYASSKPSALLGGDKIDQLGPNASQAFRSICLLRAITGNLDVAGGEVFGGYGDSLKIVSETEFELQERLSHEQRRKAIGAEKFRLMSWQAYEMMKPYVDAVPWEEIDAAVDICGAHQPLLWNAILKGDPYHVKGLFVIANNTLLQAQNTKRVYDALKALNLLVVFDIFMTPTAMMADYVLPAATWLERPVFEPEPKFNSIDASEAPVPPEYERRTDYELWSGLGRRLGQEEYWPWRSIEEVYDYRLHRLNITFKDLIKQKREWKPPEHRKYEKTGFPTPSGKVELYSSIFEKLGYDPLPDYVEPAESPIRTPKLAQDYPLILAMTGTNREYVHSTFRQVETLRGRHPDPIARLHPETARKHDIQDGDWIFIETPSGRVKQKAKVEEDALPNVVYAEHGWWYPEKKSTATSHVTVSGEDKRYLDLMGLWDSNLSVLVKDDPDMCDPICGSWPHSAMCRIERA